MLSNIEDIRRSVATKLDKRVRSELGQFFTPRKIARFMASLFEFEDKASISLLDAGAGVGSLSAAFLERVLSEQTSGIHISAYEVDKGLVKVLQDVFNTYKPVYEGEGKSLIVEVFAKDFIEHSVITLCLGNHREFDFAILNPPYRKINSNSKHRRLLRLARIETVNMYAAFVALALKLLAPKGQMVAIIPRSFCNGPYYQSFRELLISQSAIRHIHLFEARNKAFSEDDVLQENIILHLVKGTEQEAVTLSTSLDGQFSDYQAWTVPFSEIVQANDEKYFIHIPARREKSSLTRSAAIRYSLTDLGCQVSTGPVVDFRAREHLHKVNGENTVPLIYPAHFNGWTIHHPLPDFKKYNAIEVNEQTMRHLYPSGYYTLVRRFSSKEEPRRIVARVIRPGDIGADFVGFENHLNVFHHNKQGLPKELAYGLAVYLNSSAVDEYFRVFSGHTQVNATDLRQLDYPSLENVLALGEWGLQQKEFDLENIDEQVASIL